MEDTLKALLAFDKYIVHREYETERILNKVPYPDHIIYNII